MSITGTAESNPERQDMSRKKLAATIFASVSNDCVTSDRIEDRWDIAVCFTLT